MRIAKSYKFDPETVNKLEAIKKATGLDYTAIIETLVAQADYTAPVTLQKAQTAQKGKSK